VLAGQRDGRWEPGDEVRGPHDREWRALEEHPVFAEPCEYLEPPVPPHPDETKLDMNPLIDVALVLLIFFILTATYSTLRRSIDLPESPTDSKGKTTVTKEDIKDRVFKMKVTLEDDQPIIQIEGRTVKIDELEKEFRDLRATTGRSEMYLDIDPAVPWGIEARIYDAARGAEIKQIYWPRSKK
jgi:biopolymer transport protein ExbD